MATLFNYKMASLEYTSSENTNDATLICRVLIRLSRFVGRVQRAEADLLEYGYVRGCDSSKTERISPWVDRKSREPPGIATSPSEVRSALPKQRIHSGQVASTNPPPIKQQCNLTDILRKSPTLKAASGHSPGDPQRRSRNPVKTTSHMDLSPMVTYAGEPVDRELPQAAREKGNMPTTIFSDDSKSKIMSQDDSSIENNVVNNVTNQPEVVRWLDRMGPGVECPTISELAGSSTGCNTVTSYGDRFCSMDTISDASYTAPRPLPKKPDNRSFDDNDVTPVASRTDLLHASRQRTTRAHNGSYGDYTMQSLGDLASSNDTDTLDDYNRDQCFEVPALSQGDIAGTGASNNGHWREHAVDRNDESLNTFVGIDPHSSATAKQQVMSSGECQIVDNFLLPGALTELTELTNKLMNNKNCVKHDSAVRTAASHGIPYYQVATSTERFQEECDLADLTMPMQQGYDQDADTPDCRAIKPLQHPRHPAKSRQTGSYNSAIPRLKSTYSDRTIGQGHSRGVVKQIAPATKRLGPNSGGLVSSKARTIVTQQHRKETSEEDIDRRHRRKQCVSTKGLRQAGVEIVCPEYGLEETLLTDQANVRIGRGRGKSSVEIMCSNCDRECVSTSSELCHIEGSVPRTASFEESNRRYAKQKPDWSGPHLDKARSNFYAGRRWSATDADRDYVEKLRSRCKNTIGRPNGSSYSRSQVTCAYPKATRNGTHVDKRCDRSKTDGQQHDTPGQVEELRRIHSAKSTQRHEPLNRSYRLPLTRSRGTANEQRSVDERRRLEQPMRRSKSHDERIVDRRDSNLRYEDMDNRRLGRFNKPLNQFDVSIGQDDQTIGDKRRSGLVPDRRKSPPKRGGVVTMNCDDSMLTHESPAERSRHCDQTVSVTVDKKKRFATGAARGRHLAANLRDENFEAGYVMLDNSKTQSPCAGVDERNTKTSRALVGQLYAVADRTPDTRHADKQKPCDRVVKRKDAGIIAGKRQCAAADSQRFATTAVTHQADTVTDRQIHNDTFHKRQHRVNSFLPRPAKSDETHVKVSGAIVLTRRPICNSKVTNDGSVKIKHDNLYSVDGRLPMKNASKSHHPISSATQDLVRVATDGRSMRINIGRESRKEACSRDANQHKSAANVAKRQSVVSRTTEPPKMDSKSRDENKATRRGDCISNAQKSQSADLGKTARLINGRASYKRPGVSNERCTLDTRRIHFSADTLQGSEPTSECMTQTYAKSSCSSRRKTLTTGCKTRPAKILTERPPTSHRPIGMRPAKPTITTASGRPHRTQMSGRSHSSSRDIEQKNWPTLAPTLTPARKKPSITSNISGSNTYRKSDVDNTHGTIEDGDTLSKNNSSRYLAYTSSSDETCDGEVAKICLRRRQCPIQARSGIPVRINARRIRSPLPSGSSCSKSDHNTPSDCLQPDAIQCRTRGGSRIPMLINSDDDSVNMLSENSRLPSRSIGNISLATQRFQHRVNDFKSRPRIGRTKQLASACHGNLNPDRPVR